MSTATALISGKRQIAQVIFSRVLSGVKHLGALDSWLQLPGSLVDIYEKVKAGEGLQAILSLVGLDYDSIMGMIASALGDKNFQVLSEVIGIVSEIGEVGIGQFFSSLADKAEGAAQQVTLILRHEDE